MGGLGWGVWGRKGVRRGGVADLDETCLCAGAVCPLIWPDDIGARRRSTPVHANKEVDSRLVRVRRVGEVVFSFGRVGCTTQMTESAGQT